MMMTCQDNALPPPAPAPNNNLVFSLETQRLISQGRLALTGAGCSTDQARKTRPAEYMEAGIEASFESTIANEARRCVTRILFSPTRRQAPSTKTLPCAVWLKLTLEDSLQAIKDRLFEDLIRDIDGPEGEFPRVLSKPSPTSHLLTSLDRGPTGLWETKSKSESLAVAPFCLPMDSNGGAVSSFPLSSTSWRRTLFRSDLASCTFACSLFSREPAGWSAGCLYIYT
ncbi:uncharacterized protein BKA78DRAFT_324274 [Phyllosticta capitalensis]